MKALMKAFSMFLAIAAFVLVFLAGAVLCMHIIFKKDNMTQIVDQYMADAGNENTATQVEQPSPTDPNPSENTMSSVYDLLDSGNIGGIDALLSNPNLSSIMGYYGSISDITQLSDEGQIDFSQIGGGLGGMFSSVGTIFKVFKGEYGLVSLLLNFVDSKNLLSVEVINQALADENVAKYYSAPENAEQLKNAFLHTKLASRMTLEAAYVYYDYFSSASTAEGWQDRLHASLLDREGEREQDLSFLIGHAVTETDKPLVDALKEALANAMISGMTAPADKANSLSGGIHLLLNLFFANQIVIALFVLALILIALIFVMRHEEGNGLVYFGFILVFAGILLAVFRFLKNFVIGPFYNDSGSEFKAMMLFLIVGAALAGLGLIILIVPGIITKARSRTRVKKSKLDTAVPSFGEINAISQLGLGDLTMKKDNQLRRPDGLIDYYGDGRGLNAQREFKKRKEGQSGNAQSQNTGYGYPPRDDDEQQ